MGNLKASSIREYIDAAPFEARAHLETMYRILKNVAPPDTEAIKWGVPVFWDGRVLFGFAAYKTYVSFGPGAGAIEEYADELSEFKIGKGTVQIPYDRPVPEDMVRKMALYCIGDTP